MIKMGFFDFIVDAFKDLDLEKLLKPSTSIFLKEKIDENILTNTLIKIGLVSKKIEKRYFKDNNIILDIENYFCFSYSGDNDTAKITIDKENSCIGINYKELFAFDFDNEDKDNENKFILEIKEILFKDKILDEVYDKSEEYKNNIEKYEANTDDIIEKIEEKEKTEPYNLFIIKHFIKYVIDKYKEENISSEDNSANENNEDNKNITTNPFITNGE